MVSIAGMMDLLFLLAIFHFCHLEIAGRVGVDVNTVKDDLEGLQGGL
jgi:hypothetical protein